MRPGSTVFPAERRIGSGPVADLRGGFGRFLDSAFPVDFGKPAG